MKKRISCCLSPVLLVLGLFVGVLIWVNHESTYYVEAYKPHDVVLAGDDDVLRDRSTRFEFEHATVFLEWFTYDNETINTAPYKLRVVVEPTSPQLSSVDFVSVSIESSLEHEYAFAPSTQWPVVIEMTGSPKRVSHKFEPGFMFRFEDKEEISTRIEMRIRTLEKMQSETIDVRWVPVRVRHAAPIV